MILNTTLIYSPGYNTVCYVPVLTNDYEKFLPEINSFHVCRDSYINVVNLTIIDCILKNKFYPLLLLYKPFINNNNLSISIKNSIRKIEEEMSITYSETEDISNTITLMPGAEKHHLELFKIKKDWVISPILLSMLLLILRLLYKINIFLPESGIDFKTLIKLSKELKKLTKDEKNSIEEWEVWIDIIKNRETFFKKDITKNYSLPYGYGLLSFINENYNLRN